MGKKKLHKLIIENEGYIFSDGTLNLEHLLSKAYDLIMLYELDENHLLLEIERVFEFDFEFDSSTDSLFMAQYYSDARIPEKNLEQVSYLWNEDVCNLFMDISPNGYSFGSSEGDGALLGWFKIEEK